MGKKSHVLLDQLQYLLSKSNNLVGDSLNPCPESCILVEKHLLGELESLVPRLIQSVGMRSSTIIEPDDFGKLKAITKPTDFNHVNCQPCLVKNCTILILTL